MRTQGKHNAKVRLSIFCPSAEKTDSQIYRLKKTDLSQSNLDVSKTRLNIAFSIKPCLNFIPEVLKIIL